MGAANALSAYRTYAGKLPQTSLSALVYMALVSLDRDGEPCWWEGHEVLSLMALGREVPSTEDASESPERARDRAAALRAVERAVTPLFAAGAITTNRHSSNRNRGGVTARYRLWLDAPAPDEKRRVTAARSPDEKRRPVNAVTRRNLSGHPTKSGQSPDEKRRPKEYEEEEERDNTSVPDLAGTEEGSPLAAVAPGQDPDCSSEPQRPPGLTEEQWADISWLARPAAELAAEHRRHAAAL